ncbi:MAG: cation transporter [Gammaproteobacteria bacterium]|nr:cation transporter [Gammaproteobacteria bacterium]MBL6999268.1 cation transporter [Gammaproteobacteria bacterium]
MSHSHHHPAANYNRAFAIGISLNLIFVVIEASYGIMADSLALIADAGHNLSDVISLLLAWGANRLATRPSSAMRTYGLRRVTILASLASAVLLLLALGGIAWEAFGRLFDPQPVEGMIIIIVAAIGVVINSLTAWLFMAGQQHDLNIRAAYLHMAADAGISLGVVIAGVLILFSGWIWIDPVLSLAIVLVILIGTWQLLKESVNLSVDAVPNGTNMQGIRDYFHSIAPVMALHDLHVWALSTTETALTVHLVIDQTTIDNGFLLEIQQHLHDHFDIEHSTIQVENGATENCCMLNRPECV